MNLNFCSEISRITRSEISRYEIGKILLISIPIVIKSHLQYSAHYKKLFGNKSYTINKHVLQGLSRHEIRKILLISAPIAIKSHLQCGAYYKTLSATTLIP